MEFETVGKGTAAWEPKVSGTKKEGNQVEKQPNDKSYIQGYYLGTKEVTVNNKTFNIHEIKMTAVGNEADLTGELDESKKVSVWGTGVLDKVISENVQYGQMIQIKWEGKKAPKTPGGNNYHDWTVGVNHNAEPLMSNATPLPKELMQSNNAAPANESPVDVLGAIDDDLPFG